jgi:hypothetical protein
MYKIDDRVRVKAMPEWASRLPPESQQAIRLCAGNTFRIREIDEHGHLEIWARHGKETNRIARADILFLNQEDVELCDAI